MTSKTIRHFFYTTWSFVHHFKIIGELKLELQSENVQFESKSTVFVSRDLKIWCMTLKNNRAPLLYYVKPCVSFQSHLWIQTGVTVRKRSIRVKISDFLSRMTLKFDAWPWKTIGDFLSRGTLKFDTWPWKMIGHLFSVTSSFVHRFVATGEFKQELQSGNTQLV